MGFGYVEVLFLVGEFCGLVVGGEFCFVGVEVVVVEEEEGFLWGLVKWEKGGWRRRGVNVVVNEIVFLCMGLDDVIV